MIPRVGTVLLVEDDEDIRTATADVLIEEGYTVRLAANGDEALRWLRSGLRPCVILLDLMMPVMDGLTFLKVSRAQGFGEIPVVVVSASMQLPAGVEVCPKPANLSTLFGHVSRHCGSGV